jgi:hypothetical protein
MPINFYPRTSLTGGVAGSLDNLDGADLADLDIAMVGQTAVDAKFYVLDDDSGAAESSPGVIAPDTNPGTKRWILLGHTGASFTVGNTIITDGVLTDSGPFQITTTGQIILNASTSISIPLGAVLVGANNSKRGYISLYGDANTQGGTVYLYTGTAHDTYIDYFQIRPNENDLEIGSASDPDVIKLIGNASADSIDSVTITRPLIANSTLDTLAANEWSKPQNVDETALTSTSNAVAWDASSVQTGLHTLTENTTISAPSNLKAGATYILRVVQAAGVYTLAFNAVFKWGAATAPTAPAANGDVLILSFYSDGTNMYGVEAVREEA